MGQEVITKFKQAILEKECETHLGVCPKKSGKKKRVLENP